VELRELLTDAERTQFLVVSIATQLSFAESERLVQVTFHSDSHEFPTRFCIQREIALSVHTRHLDKSFTLVGI
jgi:hypothetical protein